MKNPTNTSTHLKILQVTFYSPDIKKKKQKQKNRKERKKPTELIQVHLG